MPRTITKERNSLLIDEGGVEIPEVRDGNYSVTLLLRVGTTTTTGLHWHERKTGKQVPIPSSYFLIESSGAHIILR